ncbi:hypothetical protein DM01DRAFT_1380641 [Hesseltinella vesiculosa]|uniref:Bromo domain-containing protein n=1 Tax=Hesseltinella vesiculosa TaxID=101127 RepID=A0A1X2GS07_9FUNG|nr:hypothetical protein DM01DRAFT_1380641 [Hesseltinella vesiculosa]
MLSYLQSDHWPQLSFLLAKDILDKKLHTTYLTPSETDCFEQATSTLAQWIAFINPTPSPDSPTPLSELDTSSFRIRSLLFELFIPHLFHTNRPCCQHLQLDLHQLAERAQTIASPAPADIDKAKKEFDLQRQDQIKQLQDQQSHHATDIPNDHATPEHQAMSNGLTRENGDDIPDKQPISAMADTDKIPLLDIYHTFETDEAVMIDQQKLKEYEAQAALNEEEEKEKSEDHSLSMFNADGNFTLKYLLKGIAAKRDTNAISDHELQDLLSDFKPHRSKWANDEKQGQEELYEAMEKVLVDLKNYTQHSTPFLNKVSKRDAPDYFDIINRPMDLGTVTKKLKNFEYKSKNQFSDDLYLIYENCLAYNTNPSSEYRKHATAMRRKTDKILIRVPNIIIKDKSDGGLEEEEDEVSDDEQEDKGRVSGKALGKHKQPMKQIKKDETPVDSLDRFSRERSMTRGSSAAPTDSVAGDTDRDMSPAVYDTHITYGGKHVKGQGHPLSGSGDLDDDDDDDDNKEDLDLTELREQVWREVTKKTRAERAREMLDLVHEPFGDQHALVRSAFDMERFAMIEHNHDKTDLVRKLIRCPNKNLIQWTDRRRPADASLYDDDVDLDSSDDEILDAFFSRKIAKPKHAYEDDASRADLFLPEYNVTAGFPEMAPYLNEEYKRRRTLPPRLARRASMDSSIEDLAHLLDDRGYTDVSVGVYPSTLFPDHGLNVYMDRNIQCLLQIRRVYAKCKMVRNNPSLSSMTAEMMIDSPETAPIGSPLPVDHKYLSVSDADLSPLPSTTTTLVEPLPSAELPVLIVNEASARNLFELVTTKVLAHAGFEGAQASALQVLNDVAVDYISNLGKMLRSYFDSYSKKMSSEEIIMHTLYESGVTHLNQLDSYIHDDVRRYGHRLDDVYRRLQASYQDLVTGSPEENPAVDEDAIFQEVDTFVTGLFGEDFGDDYLGFKDLGLDQELGVNATSIPARLWFGKTKDKMTNMSPTNKEPQYKYTPRPPFTPVTSTKQVIGLLHPYFEKKLSEDDRLVEDEFNAMIGYRRTRYPPLHQSSTGGNRKKQKDYSSSSGDKKGKRKRVTEEVLAERAEKRRLKLEEKAQKIAEREQKRRMREEERLAKQEAKERKAQARKLSKQSSLSATSPTVMADD